MLAPLWLFLSQRIEEIAGTCARKCVDVDALGLISAVGAAEEESLRGARQRGIMR